MLVTPDNGDYHEQHTVEVAFGMSQALTWPIGDEYRI